MTQALDVQERAAGEIREVRFRFVHGGETVPGLWYLPDDDGPFPVVVIQHPATSSKDDYFVRDVGQLWARKGWAAGGLDAPYHGERATHDPMGMLRDPSRFANASAQFSGELSAALDTLAARYPLDLGRLGYVGYSMGSLLGIPAVAADGRYTCAAFCLVGEGSMLGSATDPRSPVQRLGGVAVRIVAKMEDEFFPRQSAQGLFDALPGEKDITWLPGGHFEIGPDVIKAAEQWVAAHFAAPVTR
jgi:dienelactone hydrolase